MWIHKVVLEACPICSKETTLAGVEPHPTHPETELHTFRCADCGLVKTRSIRSLGVIAASERYNGVGGRTH
jgi:uncharacterized Zn finger protein